MNFFLPRTPSVWLASWLGLGSLGLFLGCGSGGGGGSLPGNPSPTAQASGSIELLNVSYDPTRELWRSLNEAFIRQYKVETGVDVTIKQSHGGSASQARSVIDGLEADVVSLAMWQDTEALHKAGLIGDGWENRLANRSLPYTSTIVFVVRKGNPRQIRDWPDLVQGDVKVITPSPKTSGNGKLSFLAAWGAVVLRGGDESAAQAFVSELYRRVPVLDSGARGSTTTFAQKGIGDVHLTWENEAVLEVEEAKGGLEIVYPPISIQAEPHVAIVDENVKRRGTAAAAEAYLRYLYTPEGQTLIASHSYRPSDPAVLAQQAERFPHLELFTIDKISSGWLDAQERFFAEGALFDRIYQPR